MQVRSDAGQPDDVLTEAGQGLIQHAGLPVSAARAGQHGAFAGPPAAGQAGEPFPQRRRGGDSTEASTVRADLAEATALSWPRFRLIFCAGS